MFVRPFRALQKAPSARRDLRRRVPWDRFPSPSSETVIQTRDDGYLVGFRVYPYDLESMPEAERWTMMRRVNEAWKRLDAGWGVWMEARTVPCPPLLDEGAWPEPVSDLLDEAHRARLNAQGLWNIEIYLYLWHRPASQTESWLLSQVMTPTAEVESSPFEQFQEGVSRWTSFLYDVCDLVPLAGKDLLTALHMPLCLHPHPVAVPLTGDDLPDVLVDCGIWPATIPMLGPDESDRAYVRCLQLDRQWPPETMALMFRQLYTLDFPFRACSRWIPDARQQAHAHLDVQQRELERSSQNVWDILSAWRHREARRDSHVERQDESLDTARDLMLSDEFVLGNLTTTFVVMDTDLREVNRRLLAIEQVIQAAGCTVTRAPYNTVEAFMSTMPGLPYVNRYELKMTSLNWACIAPWSAPYQGPRRNHHLNGPVLTTGITHRSLPVRLTTHVGDLPHSRGIGPSGAGKSTTLNWFRAQWMRYPEAQSFAWDIGGSGECLTRCVGGAYHDLGHGDVDLQPLAGLDDPQERGWIYEWLLDRVEEANIPRDGFATKYVWGAMRGLWESRHPRMIASLILEMAETTRYHERLRQAQGEGPGRSRMIEEGLAIQSALRPFAQGGAYGHLTDAPKNTLQIQRFHTFNLDDLLKLPRAYPAVLSIIFHELKRRFDGRSTRLDFDEAWHYFSSPVFMRFLPEEIPAWRRLNVSGNFWTQSMTQLANTPLTPLLVESTQLAYWFPNPQALDANVRSVYEGMGLDEEEIARNIVMARPKREFYLIRPEGRQLVDLEMTPLAKAICGANSREDHARMDQVRQQYGDERFAVGWLRAKGFPDDAQRVEHALAHRRDDADVPAVLAATAAD